MIVMGIDYNTYKQIYAYAPLENNGIICFNVLNINGEFDYDTLKNDAASIAKTAKYQLNSNNIKGNDKVKDIDKFIK